MKTSQNAIITFSKLAVCIGNNINIIYYNSYYYFFNAKGEELPLNIRPLNHWEDASDVLIFNSNYYNKLYSYFIITDEEYNDTSKPYTQKYQKKIKNNKNQKNINILCRPHRSLNTIITM